MIKEFENKLDFLGLPMLGDYAIFDLEMNTLLLFINLGEEHIIGSLLDKSKIAFGTLFHIAIPKIIKLYNEL